MRKRVVVKVGTSTLTGGAPTISHERLSSLALQLVQLRNAGCQVVLVSSGAIAAGRERLAQPALSKAVPAKQMLAAVGQPRLMAMYDTIRRVSTSRTYFVSGRLASMEHSRDGAPKEVPAVFDQSISSRRARGSPLPMEGVARDLEVARPMRARSRLARWHGCS